MRSGSTTRTWRSRDALSVVRTGGGFCRPSNTPPVQQPGRERPRRPRARLSRRSFWGRSRPGCSVSDCGVIPPPVFAVDRMRIEREDHHLPEERDPACRNRAFGGCTRPACALSGAPCAGRHTIWLRHGCRLSCRRRCRSSAGRKNNGCRHHWRPRTTWKPAGERAMSAVAPNLILRERLGACRVAGEGRPSPALTEPDLWASHPALRDIGVGELNRLNRCRPQPAAIPARVLAAQER